MFGHLLKRGAVVLCLAAVLALPVCAEGRITTDMTMKEIRSDPAMCSFRADPCDNQVGEVEADGVGLYGEQLQWSQTLRRYETL